MVLACTAAAAAPVAACPGASHRFETFMLPAPSLGRAGLPAAGLRLRGAPSLPGLLLQRRSGPVRLESVCGGARSGARGRDRRARRVVRQLASGCATRPRGGGRQPAAVHRNRHRLRRRAAQSRPGARAMGRIGGRPRHRVRRVCRSDCGTGGGPSVSQHRRATLPGYRRRVAGRHQCPADRPQPSRQRRPRARLLPSARRPGDRQPDRNGTLCPRQRPNARQAHGLGRAAAGTFVVRVEDEGVSVVARRVASGSTVDADEAACWDALHARFATKRINHSVAFSDDGACTNQAESYVSRLRRAEFGQAPPRQRRLPHVLRFDRS